MARNIESLLRMVGDLHRFEQKSAAKAEKNPVEEIELSDTDLDLVAAAIKQPTLPSELQDND